MSHELLRSPDRAADLRYNADMSAANLQKLGQQAIQNDDKTALANVMKKLTEVVGPIAAEQLLATEDNSNRFGAMPEWQPQGLMPGAEDLLPPRQGGRLEFDLPGFAQNNPYSEGGEVTESFGVDLPPWMSDSPYSAPMPPEDLPPEGAMPPPGDPSNLIPQGPMQMPAGVPQGPQTRDETLFDQSNPDAFGIVPDLDSEAIDRTVKDMSGNDEGRGGSTINPTGGPTAAAPENAGLTPSTGLFPGARDKVLEFLGTKDDAGREQLGMALMGFGSGMLSGGGIGGAFSKASDQFVATKQDQQQASLNDQKIAITDENMRMKRESHQMAMAAAARKRTGTEPDNIVKLRRDRALRADGFREDGAGGWEVNPDFVGQRGEKALELRRETEQVMADNPGMQRSEAQKLAERLLGVKPEELSFTN